MQIYNISVYELCPAEVFDSLDALVANARLKQPSPDVRTSSFARDDNRENNCGEVIEQNGQHCIKYFLNFKAGS